MISHVCLQGDVWYGCHQWRHYPLVHSKELYSINLNIYYSFMFDCLSDYSVHTSLFLSHLHSYLALVIIEAIP